MEIARDKNGESRATMMLEDELTYVNVVATENEVKKHLNDFDHLHIHANLSQIDLSGIQLLYSVKKSCLNAKKQIVISLRMNTELENLIIRSGFKDLLD